MEITVNYEDDFAIVQITGRVVRDNQLDLRLKLEEVIETACKGVALDLENLQYMDSAGMGCCVSVLRLMHSRNCGSLVVFGASPAIEKVWRLIRLDLVIPFFPNKEEALSRLRADASN